MRRLLISLAAAGSALAVASPAAAQYPQPYGQYPQQPYGQYPQQPYGYGYGYNNFGQVRALQARLNRIERQISRLDRRDRIGDREANRLRREADRIEQRLRRSGRNGLNPYEVADLSRRIAILEQRVQYAVGNGWGRYGNRYGWNAYGDRDRDRDGRDDRWEDDQGHRRD